MEARANAQHLRQAVVTRDERDRVLGPRAAGRGGACRDVRPVEEDLAAACAGQAGRGQHAHGELSPRLHLSMGSMSEHGELSPLRSSSAATIKSGRRGLWVAAEFFGHRARLRATVLRAAVPSQALLPDERQRHLLKFLCKEEGAHDPDISAGRAKCFEVEQTGWFHAHGTKHMDQT